MQTVNDILQSMTPDFIGFVVCIIGS